MKTKQYSKEGLLAKEKLDPTEVAKMDASNWITTMVDKLSTQVDALEAESELLNAAKGRRGAKVDTARLKAIEKWVDMHKFHQDKLEHMLRSLENDAITVDEVWHCFWLRIYYLFYRLTQWRMWLSIMSTPTKLVVLIFLKNLNLLLNNNRIQISRRTKRCTIISIWSRKISFRLLTMCPLLLREARVRFSRALTHSCFIEICRERQGKR